MIALGGHFLLKQFARTTAFSGTALQELRATKGLELPGDIDLASAILESPLYVEIPPLQIVDIPKTLAYEKGPKPSAERIDFAGWLPAAVATYFSTDIAVVQVYLYFVGYCTGTGEVLQTCQKTLLDQSYAIVSKLKHNPAYILYRLEGGYIQLIATYIFALGLLVFALREFRASQINFHLEKSRAGEDFAKNEFGTGEFAAADLPSLSLRATLRAWWENGPSNADTTGNVDHQLREFGMVTYEPESPPADPDKPEGPTKAMTDRASLLRKYHLYLAATLRGRKRMRAAERFRDVLPRAILKVVAAFVGDQRHFPESGRERAGEALDHAVDELAARIAADRDLYSRFVELAPVVGFFGTVWGLSLAMLGANDVIRAQGSNWNYVIASNTTYMTEALQRIEEKQQFALQGMLSALSIKFDTTGYALILMFLLILLGAHATRREYRALSLLHSNVAQKVLSVLPAFGSTVTQVPNIKIGANVPRDQGWGPE